MTSHLTRLGDCRRTSCQTQTGRAGKLSLLPVFDDESTIDYFRLAAPARFLVERVAVLRAGRLLAVDFLAVDLAATRFLADFLAVVRLVAFLRLEAAFFLVAPLRFLADLEAVARLVDFLAVAFFAVVFFLAAPVRDLADFLAVLRVVGFFAADFFAVLRVVVLAAISVGSLLRRNWVP